MSGTTITCPAGFFQNDLVTPATIGDLQGTVETALQQAAIATAAAQSAQTGSTLATASANNALAWAAGAQTSATNAAASEANAAASLAAAETQATNAATSANTASTAATNASNSAASASTSASTANTAATTASNAAAAASTAAASILGGALTAPFSVNTAGATAVAVYHQILPSMPTWTDNIQSVVINPSGSTLGMSAAVSGYVKNQNAQSNGFQNGVALFGIGISEVDHAYTWGINTLLQDNATPTVGSGVGRLLQNEFDYNIYCAGTTVNGLTLEGEWYAQPAVSNGFVVGKPGGPANGYWAAAYVTGDGAAKYGLFLGLYEQASGDSIPGQIIRMANTDASGTYHQTYMQAQPGNALTIWGDTTPTVHIEGNVTIDDTLTVSGTATAPTPPQFDNSTNVATTAWVSGVGPRVTGQTVISGNTSLTSAAVGNFIPIITAGVTTTMPKASTVAKGSGFALKNESSGTVLLAAYSGDTIPFTSMNSDGVIWLFSDGVSTWWCGVNTRGNPKASITGSRGSATATVLENLLQALGAMGLVVDNTTA